MEDKVEKMLSFCSEIDFGAVPLSGELKQFRSEMDDEIISLCTSLPKSTQADALFLFMRYFRIPFGRDFSIFTNYYALAWSIIYWLIQSGPGSKGLRQEDMQNAKRGHSMALLLHPIDDHLNDNEWESTHLAMLLRSQAWMIMNSASKRLADGIDGGAEIVQGFIDDYYSGIRNSKEMFSLDSYCDLFRKQMATGYIAPALITRKTAASEEFDHAVRTAYGSFGIAWRLLDDINDIQTDLTNHTKSAIYCCLSKSIRDCWNTCSEEEYEKKSGCAKVVFDYIVEKGVIDRIRGRICAELDSAASIADDYDMTGLADEFRCLLRPLSNTPDELWTRVLKQKSTPVSLMKGSALR